MSNIEISGSYRRVVINFSAAFKHAPSFNIPFKWVVPVDEFLTEFPADISDELHEKLEWATFCVIGYYAYNWTRELDPQLADLISGHKLIDYICQEDRKKTGSNLILASWDSQAEF